MANIKFGKRGKPIQPENISVEDLFENGVYSKVIFDYVLLILKEKFEKTHNTKLHTTMVPLKTPNRVKEKLKEDDIENASDILDIVRATVSLKTVEELLEFLQFISTNPIDRNSFEEEYDFTKPSFSDKTISYNYEKKDENDQPITNTDGKLVLEETHQTDLIVKKFNNIKQKGLITKLPETNVHIKNAFHLDTTPELIEKYKFLSKFSVKDSNYMDFKFYIYIPIPSLEDKSVNDYMICEVIATLDCFYHVGAKTHVIFEALRTFQHFKEDDIEPDTLILALNALLRGIHVDDVITKYNEEHKDSIKILPYKDNKKLREDILNNVDSSFTFTKLLCGCRDL